MKNMANLKMMVGKADDDILSQLIQACEGKMSDRFKPKMEEVEIEGHSPDDSEDSETDVEKLLEMYKMLKGD